MLNAIRFEKIVKMIEYLDYMFALCNTLTCMQGNYGNICLCRVEMSTFMYNLVNLYARKYSSQL